MQRDEINKFSESLTAKEASTSSSELPDEARRFLAIVPGPIRDSDCEHNLDDPAVQQSKDISIAFVIYHHLPTSSPDSAMIDKQWEIARTPGSTGTQTPILLRDCAQIAL